jgi:hypothetical protein
MNEIIPKSVESTGRLAREYDWAVSSLTAHRLVASRDGVTLAFSFGRHGKVTRAEENGGDLHPDEALRYLGTPRITNPRAAAVRRVLLGKFGPALIPTDRLVQDFLDNLDNEEGQGPG